MIVLMPNCAWLSETSRMLELHRALVTAGAEAVVATHGGSHLSLLQESEVDVTMLDPVVSLERSAQFVQDGPGIGSPDQSIWTDEELRACALSEAEYLRDVGATAVVTGFQLTALLSSRLAGVPLATSHAGSWCPPILDRRMMPAMGEIGPPLPGWMPDRLARWLTNVASARGTFHVAGFNRVAAELGVEPVPTFAALMCGDLTLVTEAPQVLGIPEGELHAWRPGRRFRPATRMAYAGPVYARLDLPVPTGVEEFLATGDPPVYVALTSTDAATVTEAVQGVRAAGHRALVATTLHDRDDLGGLDRDDGVLAVPFLPSHQLMPRCSAAVVTGGQGSVQTALATGTPFASLPLQPEQVWNVHLAERLGAAIRVDRSALANDAAAAVTTLTTSTSHRTAAERVAGIYARIDGPARAAEHILHLAEKTSTSPRHQGVARPRQKA